MQGAGRAILTDLESGCLAESSGYIASSNAGFEKLSALEPHLAAFPLTNIRVERFLLFLLAVSLVWRDPPTLGSFGFWKPCACMDVEGVKEPRKTKAREEAQRVERRHSFSSKFTSLVQDKYQLASGLLRLDLLIPTPNIDHWLNIVSKA
ncbi:hypothetical protein MGYG_09165 [Nannizzia gypsea CBS 118893]|uniref:Uncharacterized protein n=1 Tax=Arthroderma gypseum (strain ATCC MYA-4604 / CBS 118893) TaxID=535722 RepID=E4V3V9_ARTGP|nr:hypothetical protein MGYG_09165 [Nannizzia gypsea CBS 118893]EFR04683.1 hypothetical protein MGYG_09165 [Nannizzia gypsea CBS 118893]